MADEASLATDSSVSRDAQSLLMHFWFNYAANSVHW